MGAHILGTVLLIGAVLIGAAKALVASDKEKPFSDSGAVKVGLSALSALITTAVNFAVKSMSLRLTEWEGQDTKTEYESSLFRKLTLAYCVSTVLIPLLLGVIFSWYVSGKPIDQSWFEEDGVLAQVCGQQ